MHSWAYALDPAGGVAAIPSEAARHHDGGTFVWVHLDAREEDAARWLKQHADLPDIVTAPLLAVETRPRIEPIGEGSLVNLRGQSDDGDETADALASIRMWADHGRLISVSFRPLRAMAKVKAAMAAGKLHDPGDLISVMAHEISIALDPVVAELGDRIDACEVELDPKRAFQLRRTIGAARSEAIGLRRFVVPQRQALEKLAELETTWLDDDDRLHARAAADRFARMAEELEAVRERSALLHEQLTDLRAETVETRTLILSIVALVFLPLTFITGLLGMNVEGIPGAHEPWAFWGVVGVCAAVGIAITGYFVRARWFRR